MADIPVDSNHLDSLTDRHNEYQIRDFSSDSFATSDDFFPPQPVRWEAFVMALASVALVMGLGGLTAVAVTRYR